VIIKELDFQITRWDPEEFGDRMFYQFIEEDASLFRAGLDISVTSTFNFLNTNIANVNARGVASFRIGGGR